MLQATRRRFAALQAQAALAGMPLRPPPPEPATCCGRGCNGCVWEGFYAAAQWWCDDAQQLLAAHPKPSAAPPAAPPAALPQASPLSLTR